MATKTEKLKAARRKRDRNRKRRPVEASPWPAADALPNPEDAPYFRDMPPIEERLLGQLRKPFRVKATNLGAAIRLNPDQIADCDPARLNLLCAEGLPGAEDLDIDEYLHRLDVWSVWIAMQSKAEEDYFHSHKEEYFGSEPYWRMLSLTTTLQLHFGIRYEPKLMIGTNWDWKDSRDVLLNGLLGPRRTGSCPSLPVLLVVIARRLGYPLYQVHAPAHAFSRWDGTRPRPHQFPTWRQSINFECHGKGLLTTTDEHYKRWPVSWTFEVIEAEKRRRRPLYLRNLDPAEMFAASLLQRAYVLLEHKRYDECYVAAMAAGRFWPGHPMATLTCQDAHRHKLKQALRPWGLSDTKFFDRLKRRQAGDNITLPWESAGQDPMHPGQPAPTEPVGTSKVAQRMGAEHAFHMDESGQLLPQSMIADPIAAAMSVFGMTHTNGERSSGAPSIHDIPELTLENAQWKTTNGLPS